MQKVYLLLFLILSCTSAQANNNRGIVGGQAAGMGFTSLTNVNAFSVINNQAALSLIDEISIGAYAENRFLLKELSFYSLAAAIPTNSGTLGIGFSYFGDEFLNEKLMRLAYGRRLMENLSIGVELDYFNVSINEYGSTGVVTFGLGVLYEFRDDWQLAAHLFNPIDIKLTDQEDEDYLYNQLRIGLSHQVSQKVKVSAEAEKNMEEAMSFRAGVHYQIDKKVACRLGYASQPDLFTFGVGFNLGALQIDVASGLDWELGYSPYISINYLTQKRAKD